MKELNQLYKDLIKMQTNDQIVKEMGRKEFWIGFGFIITGLMIIINLLLI